MDYIITDKLTGLFVTAGARDFSDMVEASEFEHQQLHRGYLVHWGDPEAGDREQQEEAPQR